MVVELSRQVKVSWSGRPIACQPNSVLSKTLLSNYQQHCELSARLCNCTVSRPLKLFFTILDMHVSMGVFVEFAYICTRVHCLSRYKKYLKGGRGKIDIILKVKVTVMSAQCIATYIFVSGNKEDKGEEWSKVWVCVSLYCCLCSNTSLRTFTFVLVFFCLFFVLVTCAHVQPPLCALEPRVVLGACVGLHSETFIRATLAISRANLWWHSAQSCVTLCDTVVHGPDLW